jgi:hypothetical protein
MSDFIKILNVLTDLSKIPNFIKLYLAAYLAVVTCKWTGQGLYLFLTIFHYERTRNSSASFTQR